MVGISITSAPISRKGAASPPDCLLARVVRTLQPLSGSSAFTFAAAVVELTADFLVPVADLFMLMVASALQLPARTHRSEFCRRRATAASVLFHGPVSRRQCRRPARAKSGFHRADQP